MAVALLSLILMFAGGWYAYRLAERKGRNPRMWMVLTVLLLVPLAVLIALPPASPIEPPPTRAA